MRRVVALVRDGQPFDADGLADGDEITFEVLSGEVLQIADGAGNLKWKSVKEPSGKTAYMLATRKEKDDH